MNPMIVMMAASTAFSIYGNWKAQQDKEEAARRQHAYAVRQSAEMNARLEYNKDLVYKTEREAQGQVVGIVAKSGMEMSGSVLDAMVGIARTAEQERRSMEREAEYNIEMIMAGADANLDVIRKEGDATRLATLGNLFQFGASAYDKWDKTPKDKKPNSLLGN